MRKFSSDIPYVFDNDCLASFLWIKRTDILQNLFPRQILVPELVINELSFLKRTRYSWVYQYLLQEISNGVIEKLSLPSTGPIAKEYYKLISSKVSMGHGEAAVLSYVKFNGGTVASNNLQDVLRYCRLNNLGLISTDDILCYACIKGLINKQEGDVLWIKMKQRKRILPAYSFSEALKRFEADQPK